MMNAVLIIFAGFAMGVNLHCLVVTWRLHRKIQIAYTNHMRWCEWQKTQCLRKRGYR